MDAYPILSGGLESQAGAGKPNQPFGLKDNSKYQLQKISDLS